ncbi:hypothetical protein [Phycicoccus sp. Soil802]|uniref:hypothetical protein n=1 Tax=Phycicoccus sp. Soil802 TaxID=1736414 RepID=UPI0007033D78|nr:hypothetical protein [Phycicoccus sp. Soil802]KRF29009.1 hypothetical protein ASG91_05175 [Phycicoccus sp. Soil802]
MTRSSSTVGLSRAVLVGAGSGVIASVVMAMYAMVAAWVKGAGFFTPLHHSASLWASQDPMMTSMQDASAGSDLHFVFGTALLGAIIHMRTGAMYGAIFGIIVSRLRRGLPAGAGIGLVYGFLVFAVSAYVALPIAAAIFDSGDPLKNMAQMAGWGTFIIEHLLYGLALGVLVALDRTRSRPSATVPATAIAR